MSEPRRPRPERPPRRPDGGPHAPKGPRPPGGKRPTGGPRPGEASITITLEHTRNPRQRPLWLFDNMVASTTGPPADGHAVTVYDRTGKFLGSAIYNGRSRIRARMFTLDRKQFDESYITSALEAAVERRRPHFPPGTPCRLVFSDADFIPGLIADQFGPVLVIQLLTLAANRLREHIRAELQRLTGARAVVMRFDAPIRAKEGLEVLPAAITGDVPRPLRVDIDNYCLFADPVEGQKTGLYLDQVWNRRLVTPHVAGKRVLDMYCHTGGWTMACCAAGAASAVGVDSSGPALAMARQAATANGFGQASFIEADAFDFLEKALTAGDKYDIVICDPPAFAKTTRMVEDAIRGYLSLNYRAIKILAPGGILATCSCSQAVSAAEFDSMLETAARNARKYLHVIARTGAPPDHPVLLGFPESDYLKCRVLRHVG